MAFIPVTARLGGVGLDYVPFSWPFYRGTSAIPVQIKQGARKGERLKGIARDTVLSFTDPFGTTLNIGCALLAIENVGPSECVLTLADRRWLLTRHHMPHDINIRWGIVSVVSTTGDVTVDHRYVLASATREGATGAKAATIAEALAKVCEVVNTAYPGAEVLPTAFIYTPEARTIADTTCPDNTLIGGQSIAAALDMVLRPAGLDLTVHQSGAMRIVTRATTGSEDGALSSVRWVEARPAWETGSGVRKDAPAAVIVPYTKRRQYRAAYVSPGTTYSAPGHPHFRLRQRYQSLLGTGWVDLDGLLNEVNGANGIPGGFTLTDSAIAGAIYSAGWHETTLTPIAQKTPKIAGLDETVRVNLAAQLITVIDASWRRHFLLEVNSGTNPDAGAIPQGTESDGYFWDIQFGSLGTDVGVDSDDSSLIGSVRPQAVRGPWVEFYRISVLPPGNPADPEALKYSRNFGAATTEAPMSASWLDRNERIVQINPITNRLVIDRRMGALTRDDAVTTATPQVQGFLAGGATGRITGDLIIRRRDITTMADARIEYATSLEFDVSVVAKGRAPLSNRERWIEVRVETGIEGATGEAFLPVDPVATANIDPNDTEGISILSVLNKKALELHAKKRADAYAAGFREGKTGSAYAHGLAVPEIGGTIKSASIEFGTRGMATLLTKIEVGA